MTNSTNLSGGEKTDSGKDNMINTVLFPIASCFIFLMFIMALMWLKTYNSLMQKIRTLQNEMQLAASSSAPGEGALEQISSPVQKPPDRSLQKKPVTEPAAKSQGRPPQKVSQSTRADLNMQELISAGTEAMIYKAKMTRGNIKAHDMFTCKIFKQGANQNEVEKEVAIMRKLGAHKNILQLVEWELTETPYTLFMEHVVHGTLHSFLQGNQESLSKDKEIQQLFTVAAYHIAHAMDHLRSKMIVHCDLALRNIMVQKFPHEIKVAEFGLARDLTDKQSIQKNKERVPLRWYPPEYFQSGHYEFKGDVWSFGILLWEMHTFGTLPYQNLSTSEEVVSYVCAGHRNNEPEQCRPEMLQMMKDCWLEPYSLRPSFMDIVRVLENVLESDRDYVDVQNISPKMEP